MPVTTANDVAIRLGEYIRQASLQISADENALHEDGYHRYSTALANMRNKIERAYIECVDALDAT